MCTAGASALTTENLRVCAGLPREGCCDRPPWALCRDRVGLPCVATGVFSVAKGFWAAGTFVLVICSSPVAYTLSLYIYIHEAFIILSCYLNCGLT